jgi:hypothetical protein
MDSGKKPQNQSSKAQRQIKTYNPLDEYNEDPLLHPTKEGCQLLSCAGF